MNKPGIVSSSGLHRPTSGTIKPALLVLGAAAGPGPEVIRALLHEGWPVYAVDREPDALREQLAAAETGRLNVFAGDLNRDAGGAMLARTLRELRPLPGAVLAMTGCGFPPGRLLDHDSERLRLRLEADLLPHLVAIRHLLPVLADSGRLTTWLVLGGPAAEAPWSGYGHLSVSSAALRALVQVLRDETRSLPVRVRQLSICTPIRTDGNREHACSDWPNAIEVAHRIGELLIAPPADTVSYLRRRLQPAKTRTPLTST